MGLSGKVGRLLVVGLALCGQGAGAALLVTQRDVSSQLLLTDFAAFSDARLRIDEIYTWHADNPGDTASQNYSFSQPASNISFTSSDPASLAITSFTSSSSLASFSLRSNDAVDQTTMLRFDRVPSGGVLGVGVTDGHNVLTIGRNPAGAGSNIDVTVYVEMPGDWSTAGTGTGNHQLLAINALWTIDQNFLFDGTNTIFAAHLDNYVPNQGQEPGLQFRLIGAAVPASGTHHLVALALIGLGGLRWRRRQVVGGTRGRTQFPGG